MPRLTVLVALTLAAAAAADEGEELARSHFATGVVYFDRGEYRKALREFVEARAASSRPEFDFNIGKTYENLGDAARAVRWYRSYLAARPDAADGVATREAIERLARRVGTLAIAGGGPGVRLALDGEPLDLDESGRAVATEGPHLLTVERDGAPPRRIPLQVVAGVEAPVSVAAEPPPAIVAPPPTTSREAPPPRRWKVWLAVGAAAVVVAVGAIVLAVLLHGTDYVAQAHSSCPGCPVLEFK